MFRVSIINTSYIGQSHLERSLAAWRKFKGLLVATPAYHADQGNKKVILRHAICHFSRDIKNDSCTKYLEFMEDMKA